MSRYFPVTTGAYQTSYQGPTGSFTGALGGDIYVAKLNPAGTALVYATYVGSSGLDWGYGIGVDASGSAYVTGQAASDFPTTPGAYRPAHVGGGVLFKLNATGSALVYSTSLGFSGSGIAVNAAGNAYITGSGGATKGTPWAFQETGAGCGDVLVAKFNPAGSSLLLLTYLGGSGWDRASDIALDPSENIYITGFTWSLKFPTTAGAPQRQRAGPEEPECPFQGSQGVQTRGLDAFAAKLNPAGTRLLYSTYLGGRGVDEALRIAADWTGAIYVTGKTQSSDFPTTATATQKSLRGKNDVFVAKLDPITGQLTYSTLLGGTLDDVPGGLECDCAGNVHVVGATVSPGFPLTPDAFRTTSDEFGESFLVRLTPSGRMVYSTFLGTPSGSLSNGVPEISGGPSALVIGGANSVFIGGTGGSRLPGTTTIERQFAPGTFGFCCLPVGFAVRVDHAPETSNAAPSSLAFRYQDGRLSESLAVALSTGQTSLAFRVVDRGALWIKTDVTGGETPARLNISVDPAGLAPGTYTANVNICIPGAKNDPLRIPVALTIAAPIPALSSLSPDTLDSGSPDTTIVIRGTNFSSDSLVRVSGAAVAAVFVDATTLRAVIPAALLATPGTLEVIVVNPAIPNSPSPLLKLVVTGTQISDGGIFNAASFLSGAVSPGLMVTVFGRKIGPATLALAALDESGRVATSVAETRVLFDGVAGPLIYASATQTAAMVPFSVTGRSTTQVVVEFQGARSPRVSTAVLQATPGIFTNAASGTGQAAALNADGSVNGPDNPTTKGSVVVIYATGSGQTEPAGEDGRLATDVLPKPVLPVSVQIGGAGAEILYAGAAPGLVAGVLQINAVVPQEAATGPAIPIILRVGQAESRAGVTLAIQ